MFTAIIALIFARPFISSLAYPYFDIIYSAILIACVIIWLGTEKPYAANIKAVIFPLSLFLAGILVSVIGARDKITSLLEIYKFIPCVLVFYAAIHFDDAKRRTCILAILGSGLTVCVLAIYQYFIGYPHLAAFIEGHNITSPVAQAYIQSKRVFLPFVTPNILAGFCAMLVPLTLIENRSRWLLLPLGLVLMLTKSIGGLFALSAALYLSFFIFTKFKPERMAILTLLLALAGFILIMRFGLISNNTDRFFSHSMRIEYWRNTLIVIRSAPFFGVGPGNMEIARSLYTHNSYLQLWAESGILALAGFLWLCISAIKRASKSYLAFPRRTETPFIVCSLFVFMFHNTIDFSFFLPETSMAWWVMLGLLRD